jgi:hypothetical protein
MKRRRFLQLGAAAAAASVIRPAWADRGDLPRTNPPDVIDGSAGRFSRAEHLMQEPDQIIEMLFENQWIIDGQSASDVHDLDLQPGLRYRLRMINATAQPCFAELRRRVEVTRVNQIPVSGILKETVRIDHFNVVEADFFG